MKKNLSALAAMVIATQIKEVGIHLEGIGVHGKFHKRTIFKGPIDSIKNMELEVSKLRPQPQKSDSPALQKVDYRGGDSANTFQEYKEAVSDYYTCEGNDIAKKMNPLWGPVIMVYGEDHMDTKIPSLRGESGALMVESGRPDLSRLSKYKENPNNVFVQIETGIPGNLEAAFEKIKIYGREFIDIIAPNEKIYEKIISQLDTKSDSIHDLIEKMNGFMIENYTSVYLSSTPEKKEILEKAKNNYMKAFREKDEAYLSTEKAREDSMIRKTVKRIKKLKPNSAATVVVGDNHIGRVSKGISNAFPERAVVRCKLRM